MTKKTSQIEIDGVSYIPVKEAAFLAEYTADYVGQLCRGGKVEATRVGRAWYVSEESIIAHKESKSEPPLPEKKDEEEINIHNNIRAEVDAQLSRRRLTPNTIFRDSSFIVYSKDDSPLIPVLNPVVENKEEEISPARDENGGEEKQTEEVLQLPYEQPRLLLPKFSKLFAPFMAFTSFAIVFLMVFSLNGSYTGRLIGSGINNVVATVASTEAGKVVDSDILDPFRKSALNYSEFIDKKVLQIIYGEEIYDTLYKR